MPESGRVIQGNGVSGALCLATPWPGQARTVWGDHQRFKDTYFKQYRGLYFTGDGCRRDGSRFGPARRGEVHLRLGALSGGSAPPRRAGQAPAAWLSASIQDRSKTGLEARARHTDSNLRRLRTAHTPAAATSKASPPTPTGDRPGNGAVLMV